jgi:hypothetical protein
MGCGASGRRELAFPADNNTKRAQAPRKRHEVGSGRSAMSKPCRKHISNTFDAKELSSQPEGETPCTAKRTTYSISNSLM